MPSKELLNYSIQVCLISKRNFTHFFCYLEPIGGSKPKLSEDSKLNQIVRNREDSMALLCPAQGYPIPAFRLSFPKIFFETDFDLCPVVQCSVTLTPAFRCVLIAKRNFMDFFLWYLEPIGGSKPQLSEDSSFKRILRSKEDSMALLCPAQGYPTPAFRLSFWKNKLLISQDPKKVTS